MQLDAAGLKGSSTSTSADASGSAMTAPANLIRDNRPADGGHGRWVSIDLDDAPRGGGCAGSQRQRRPL